MPKYFPPKRSSVLKKTAPLGISRGKCVTYYVLYRIVRGAPILVSQFKKTTDFIKSTSLINFDQKFLIEVDKPVCIQVSKYLIMCSFLYHYYNLINMFCVALWLSGWNHDNFISDVIKFCTISSEYKSIRYRLWLIRLKAVKSMKSQHGHLINIDLPVWVLRTII